MSNQKDKRVKNGPIPIKAQPGDLKIPNSSQPGKVSNLLKLEGASAKGNSGFTTPDTFFSLPSCRKNTLQTLHSASDALEDYIRNFEGKPREKYFKKSLKSLLSPAPSKVFIDMVDKMMQEGILNKFEDSNSLIEWVNKAYKQELDRTCRPAFETKRITDGVPRVSRKEITKHVFQDRAINISPLPSSPEIEDDDIETVNTDALLNQSQNDTNAKRGFQLPNDGKYPKWLDNIRVTKVGSLNDSRSSTVSGLLKSNSKNNYVNKSVRRSKPESKKYVGTDDTDSVCTELLLETSVYGNEPVNMGGKMHTPLYTDKKVKELLENSKYKKKQHLPHNSFLSRTVHRRETDVDPTYHYQWPNGKVPLAAANLRMFEDPKRNASTPLPNRGRAGAIQISPIRANSNSIHTLHDFKENHSKETERSRALAKAMEDVSQKQKLKGRVSSSMSDLDYLKIGDRAKDTHSNLLQFSGKLKPSQTSHDEIENAKLTPYYADHSRTVLEKKSSSRWDSKYLSKEAEHVKYSAENVSHKTSGYQSGTPSFRERDHKTYLEGDGPVRIPSSVPPIICRKESGLSDCSGNTDKIVRKSPTGIKYHLRSRTWNNTNQSLEKLKAYPFNTSAPGLVSINVITKRLEKQRQNKQVQDVDSPYIAGKEKRDSNSLGNNYNDINKYGMDSYQSTEVSSLDRENGELIESRWVPYDSTSKDFIENSDKRYASDDLDSEEIRIYESEIESSLPEEKSNITSERISPFAVSDNWKEFHHPSYYEDLRSKIYSDDSETTLDKNTAPLAVQQPKWQNEYHGNRSRLSDTRPLYQNGSRNYLAEQKETLRNGTKVNCVSTFPKPGKTLSLISDTESEKFSVDTELLLAQPPMPIVNASPSLSTVSDNDSLYDSDSASTASTVQKAIPKVICSSPRLQDFNQNIYQKEVLPSSGGNLATEQHNRQFSLLKGNGDQKKESISKIGSHINGFSAREFETPEYPELMDSFISDCISSAKWKNETNSYSVDNMKKLSGGDHPGPVEALKHMLLNLQTETGTDYFLDNEKKTQSDTYKESIDEYDDTSSLPGHQSLQRAYHHLERLKTLVHERSEKYGDGSSLE